jgi:glycosyltransferase involved in cell wall biosynthesis
MISVCMTTYNGEKFISQQIVSILKQLSVDDELIISDDGSVDNTIHIIQSFNDPRIKLYLNQFGDVVTNFEFVINKSCGDIIFLSDQDDIWIFDKVVKHFDKYIDSNPRLVLSDYSLINSEGNLINQNFKNKRIINSFIFNVIKNTGIGCTMSFNKGFKDLILPFPKSLPMHDWWIFLIGIVLGNVTYIDEKLTLYRRHGNNFTKDMNTSIYKKLSWRLFLLRVIFFRLILLKIKK